MTALGLRPASIRWAADGSACEAHTGAVLPTGLPAQAWAHQVFLAGSTLPDRWAGLDDFTVADVGFGLGSALLATWQAWRDDPARPRRLHLVALVPHPPTADELLRAASGTTLLPYAQTLARVWPTRVPGAHALRFEQDALNLLLAFGEPQDLLSTLVFQADAILLDPADGSGDPAAAARWDRHRVRALARRARPGATLVSRSASPMLCEGLSAAGFTWQQMPATGAPGLALTARYTPRAPNRTATEALMPRRAVVVGAGLAGACTAAALARRGFTVDVLDRHAAAAAGSSGNPAGLFHATVHGDDGPYARLFRAGALHVARELHVLDARSVPHAAEGLLRLELDLSLGQMQALTDRQGLPSDFIQALEPAEASVRAGVPLDRPAWFYRQAGWLSPADFVRQALGTPGVQFRPAQHVHRIARVGDDWHCLNASGDVLAAAPHLVLANAEQANALLQPLGWPALPFERSRGQVTLFRPQAGPTALRLPVAGRGYVLPLPDGRVLCGATTRPAAIDGRAAEDSGDKLPSEAEHHENLARVQALCGLQPGADAEACEGRVGWRVQPADRLPAAGPVAAISFAPGTRLDQARLVPRAPGLHLSCGFGARGITLAPLLGDLVAARIAGTPWPLAQDLADAVDPARWIVRATRRGSSKPS